MKMFSWLRRKKLPDPRYVYPPSPKHVHTPAPLSVRSGVHRAETSDDDGIGLATEVLIAEELIASSDIIDTPTDDFAGGGGDFGGGGSTGDW